jgi:hypothetical protein
VKEKKIKEGGTKKEVLGSPVLQEKWYTRLLPGAHPGQCKMWITLQDDTKEILNFVLS